MLKMTPQRLVACVFVVAAIGAAPVVRAQDAAKGAALLMDARKALGGDDKLAAVKRLQANGEFKRAAGNNTNEGDFELFLEGPDKYRLDEETGIAGGPQVSRTQVLNGTDVWDETSGGGLPGGLGGRGFRGGGGGGGFDGGDRGALAGLRGRPGGDATGDAAGRQGIDPERIKDLQRRQRQADLARDLLALLLWTDQPVTWIGTAESPDGKADVLEVTPQGGVATRIFLDVNTHMPLMLTWEGGGAGRFGGFGGRGRRGDGAAPGGNGAPGGNRGAPEAVAPSQPGAGAAAAGDQPQGRRGGGAPAQVTNELHLSEYKAVNGIKLPFLITRGANGQTVEELQVKGYKINPNFKTNTFIKK
jgi:hypothetical protein